MNISFWLILLAVLLYGLLHSLLASLKAKEWARRWIGSQTERWYRLAFNFIAIITLLPILALPVLLVDKELYRIPFPWVMITTAIQLLAVIALIIGVNQTGIASFLGLSQLVVPKDVSPHRLFTGGFYRYVRHPLYTAGLVLIWLLPVMTWNLLALNIGLTAYLIIGAYVEERKLLEEFGEDYAAYRKRTPMLIPGLHLFQ